MQPQSADSFTGSQFCGLMNSPNIWISNNVLYNFAEGIDLTASGSVTVSNWTICSNRIFGINHAIVPSSDGLGGNPWIYNLTISSNVIDGFYFYESNGFHRDGIFVQGQASSIQTAT